MVGIFTLRRVNAETNEIVEEIKFENLITNQGLNRLGTGGALNFCVVGSGTTPPAVTDVMLQTARAYVGQGTSPVITTSYTQSGAVAPYWGGVIVGFRFGAGEAQGNISEIGIAYSYTSLANHALFSRALIKDAGGNPTTITILPNEFLDVGYECRSYLPPDDKTFTVEVMGTTHTLLMRGSNQAAGAQQGAFAFQGPYPLQATMYHTATIGGLTGSASGTSLGGVNTSLNAYVAGSLKRSMSGTIALGVANNVNGIGAMQFSTNNGSFQLPQYQMSVTPPIIKNNTMTISFTFEYSWGRRA